MSKKTGTTEAKRREHLETEVRFKVACEEKAFRIVERLLEGKATEESLSDCAHLINPNHYRDIVEERAISTLCGYPLCDQAPKQMPVRKKYHISSKTNTVYDITERKNFCSNRCLMASKYFEKQILITPLWMRNEEPHHQYKFLALTAISLSDADCHSVTADSDSDSDMSSIDTDDDLHSDSLWTFHYDQGLYMHGLALQKLHGTNMTTLQWLAWNFHLFSSHPAMSKSAFSDHLQLQKKLLPDTDLPSTYAEARNMINPYLVQKIKFSVCPNDCIVYRDSEKYSYKDLTKCPVCDTPRYVSEHAKRKVSKRHFSYIPLGPRLARFYGVANLGQIIQSHPTAESCDISQVVDDEMWDIHDSPTWKTLYSNDGFFAGDRMGLSLALEMDGVNPFHNIGVMYSMTPIMLTVINWPRHMRNAFRNILLVGIIPANNRSETSRQDPYVEILVDELIYLSGCTAYSEYHRAPLTVKIKLLLFILDYPGMSKLFGQHGSGSIMGCHWCLLRGQHCSHLDKVIYLSNRSYLAMDDPLRYDEIHFLDKAVDLSTKPNLRHLEAENSYRKAYDNTKNNTQAKFVSSATGCKGSHALSALPGHDRLSESHPDACHTIKDVGQNIMNLLTNRKINLSKLIQAEIQYERLNIPTNDNNTESIHDQFNTEMPPSDHDTLTNKLKGVNANKRKSHSVVKAKKCSSQPRASTSIQTSKVTATVHPYILNKKEIELADKRASSIRVPIGFGLKPSPFISKPGSLKSHDWKQLVSQGILKYCLKGCLDTQPRTTLFLLFDCLADLCAESQCLEGICDLEIRLNTALALLERDFPLSLQNITTHLLHHIIDSLKRFGPVYGTWMYVFERFNSWICQRALNMRYPESTVIETYLIFDWCQFMLASQKLTPLHQEPANCQSVAANDIDSNADFLEDFNAAFMNKTHDNKLQHIELKERDLSSLKQLCNHICSHCKFEQYCRHVQVHPKTKRAITYTASTVEHKDAKTISSIVCFERKRGFPETKLSNGRFIAFGRIDMFLLLTCTEQMERFAKVACYVNVKYDRESRLWFVQNSNKCKHSFIAMKDLSSPLVTAMDNDCLWFCNSGKHPLIR